jgi:cytochrome d ubiquinol oxidase subunit II
MPSSLGAQFDLTITNASSTEYTLKVMTYVAVVMTPLVLIYQGWTYWVFRKRVSSSQISNPEHGVLDVVSHTLHK